MAQHYCNLSSTTIRCQSLPLSPLHSLIFFASNPVQCSQCTLLSKFYRLLHLNSFMSRLFSFNKKNYIFSIFCYFRLNRIQLIVTILWWTTMSSMTKTRIMSGDLMITTWSEISANASKKSNLKKWIRLFFSLCYPQGTHQPIWFSRPFSQT